jgi:hypothetical protein
MMIGPKHLYFSSTEQKRPRIFLLHPISMYHPSIFLYSHMNTFIATDRHSENCSFSQPRMHEKQSPHFLPDEVFDN